MATPAPSPPADPSPTLLADPLPAPPEGAGPPGRHPALWGAVAVIVLTYLWPYVVAFAIAEVPYQGVTPTLAADEEAYLAQIREIYDGHYRLANPYLHEAKGAAPAGVPALPAYLVGFPLRWLQVPVAWINPLLDALIPVLIFFLLEAFLRRATGSARVGLLGALLIVFLFYCFLTQPELTRVVGQRRWFRPLSHLWFRDLPWYVGLKGLSFQRTLPHQATFPFLLGALVCFQRGLARGRRPWFLAAGALGGLLPYAYLHYAAVFPVIVAAFQGWAWGFGEGRRAREAAWTWPPFLLLLLPQVLNFLLLQPPDGMARAGTLARTHRPLLTPHVGIMLATGVGLFLLARRRTGGPRRHLLLALALLTAGVISMNQQILTGVIVQPNHFEIAANSRLHLLAVCVLLGHLSWPGKRRWSPRARLVAAWLVPVLLAGVALHLAGPARGALPQVPARYARCLEWEMTLLALLAGLGVLGSLGWLCWKVRRDPKALAPLWVGLGVGLICAEALCAGTVNAFLFQSRNARWQVYGPALTWLDQNAPPGSVVLSALDTGDQVAIHSPCDPYLSSHAWVYPAPGTAALADRLYRYLHFTGMTPEAFDQRLRKGGMERIMLFTHGDLGPGYQPVPAGVYTRERRRVPPGEVAAVEAAYRRMTAEDPLTALRRYRCDFVLAGPRERPAFRRRLETLSFLEPVYRDPNTTIYRINPVGGGPGRAAGDGAGAAPASPAEQRPAPGEAGPEADQ